MPFILLSRDKDDNVRLLTTTASPSRQEALATLSQMTADPGFDAWDAEVLLVDIDSTLPVLLVRPVQVEAEVDFIASSLPAAQTVIRSDEAEAFASYVSLAVEDEDLPGIADVAEEDVSAIDTMQPTLPVSVTVRPELLDAPRVEELHDALIRTATVMETQAEVELAFEPEAEVAAEPEWLVPAEPDVEPQWPVERVPEVAVVAEPQSVVEVVPEVTVVAEPASLAEIEPEVVVVEEPQSVAEIVPEVAMVADPQSVAEIEPEVAPRFYEPAAPSEPQPTLEVAAPETWPWDVTVAHDGSSVVGPHSGGSEFLADLEPIPVTPEPVFQVVGPDAPEIAEVVPDSELHGDYVCSECVYESTCPNKDQRLPKDCGTFQWK